MANTTVGILSLVLNTAAALAATAFTDAVTSEAEVFEFVVPRDGKYALYVKNSNTTAAKPIDVNVESGDFWMAGKGDLNFDVASEGGESLVVLEGARFKNSFGKIIVTITPTTGEVLAAKGSIKVIKLP